MSSIARISPPEAVRAWAMLLAKPGSREAMTQGRLRPEETFAKLRDADVGLGMAVAPGAQGVVPGPLSLFARRLVPPV